LKSAFGVDLPQPTPTEVSRSDALSAYIRERVTAAGGTLPFSQYMDLALNTPELGYYNAHSPLFGIDGDFVTAPEISSLFSYCVARQAWEVLNVLGGGDVLEIGAGSGRMAADFLIESARCGTLPSRYLIVEPSSLLQHRQREMLTNRIPALMERVSWLTDFPDASFRGVIVANEVLDALPAARFIRTMDGWLECHVGLNGERFVWTPKEPSNGDLREALRSLESSLGYRLPDGYTSELRLYQRSWLKNLASCLDAGLVLLMDYGYPRAEYYHPQRTTGTLRCHYRHHAHDDPLWRPGLQDISVHVDFTRVAEAACDFGLTISGFQTQSGFLIGTGLMDIEQVSAEDNADHFRLTGEIKQLTLPGEMGDAIKVLGLSRNLPMGLRGFVHGDLAGRL
jgi:SAM-dependent MidA family methyltransferase